MVAFRVLDEAEEGRERKKKTRAVFKKFEWYAKIYNALEYGCDMKRMITFR